MAEGHEGFSGPVMPVRIRWTVRFGPSTARDCSCCLQIGEVTAQLTAAG